MYEYDTRYYDYGGRTPVKTFRDDHYGATAYANGLKREEQESLTQKQQIDRERETKELREFAQKLIAPDTGDAASLILRKDDGTSPEYLVRDLGYTRFTSTILYHYKGYYVDTYKTWKETRETGSYTVRFDSDGTGHGYANTETVTHHEYGVYWDPKTESVDYNVYAKVVETQNVETAQDLEAEYLASYKAYYKYKDAVIALPRRAASIFGNLIVTLLMTACLIVSQLAGYPPLSDFPSILSPIAAGLAAGLFVVGWIVCRPRSYIESGKKIIYNFRLEQVVLMVACAASFGMYFYGRAVPYDPSSSGQYDSYVGYFLLWVLTWVIGAIGFLIALGRKFGMKTETDLAEALAFIRDNKKQRFEALCARIKAFTLHRDRDYIREAISLMDTQYASFAERWDVRFPWEDRSFGIVRAELRSAERAAREAAERDARAARQAAEQAEPRQKIRDLFE